MEFLFGSENDGPVHDYVEGLDYRYDVWKDNNTGVYRQTLKVYGRNNGMGKSGFQKVDQNRKEIVTLHDEEVMLWKYLEMEKSSSFGEGLYQVFLLVIMVVIALVLSQFFAFYMDHYGAPEAPEYLRFLMYPFSIVMTIIAIFSTLRWLDVQAERTKTKKLIACIRHIQATNLREDKNYYKELFRLLSFSSDQVRAKAARMVLEKNLV